MTIRFFRPHPLLRNVVDRYYVHHVSPARMAGTRWLVVPDGALKLIFPYRGGIGCTIGQSTRWHVRGRFIVSGMRDAPGALDFRDGVGAAVAVLRGDALHRLTGVPQSDLINGTVDGEELFGGIVRQWHEQIEGATSAEECVRLLERGLLGLMGGTDRRDGAFEWGFQEIVRTSGRLQIEHLAVSLGWSRRRLHRAFVERVGIAPKRFASVLRFSAVYNALARSASEVRNNGLVYDYYYDQSHFLKDFKRYCGFVPSAYERASDYGRFSLLR